MRILCNLHKKNPVCEQSRFFVEEISVLPNNILFFRQSGCAAELRCDYVTLVSIDDFSLNLIANFRLYRVNDIAENAGFVLAAWHCGEKALAVVDDFNVVNDDEIVQSNRQNSLEFALIKGFSDFNFGY